MLPLSRTIFPRAPRHCATTAAFGLIILLVESKMNWNWNCHARSSPRAETLRGAGGCAVRLAARTTEIELDLLLTIVPAGRALVSNGLQSLNKRLVKSKQKPAFTTELVFCLSPKTPPNLSRGPGLSESKEH